MPREGRNRIIWRALATASLSLLAIAARAQDCGGGNPCGGGDSASQSCACPNTGAGNPIDVLTGNKYVRDADFQMPGELSLSFTRHYNSLAPNGGAFGGGWSHSFETVLTRTERDGNASIQIVQADGRRIQFVQVPQATHGATRYVSAPFGYGVVIENAGDIASLRAQKFDVPGEATPWVWIWPDGRSLTFDQRGLLKRIELPSGERLTLLHDKHGRLVRITDALKRVAELEYWDRAQDVLPQYGVSAFGAQHRLRSITLSDGRSAEYRYDSNGLLVQVLYPDGSSKRYEYAQAGSGLRLIKRWSRDGKLAGQYQYDENGRAISTEQGEGLNRLVLEYRIAPNAGSLNETWVSSAVGRTVYRWEDAAGERPRLIEAVGPGCDSCPASNIRYQYDAAGLVSSIEQLSQDASATVQSKETLTRDQHGRLVSRDQEIAGAGTLVERYRYGNDEPLAKPSRIERSSIAPSEVHAFDITYNERGQPVALTQSGFAPSTAPGLFEPLSRTTRYSYYDASSGAHLVGKLRAVDGPRPGTGDALYYEYDAAGRLARVRRAQQISEVFVYDAFSRPVKYTPADGVQIEIHYDAEGRLASVQRAGLLVQISYDAFNRIAMLRDPIGQQLRLEYDAASRLTSMIDGANNRITLKLDDAGRVLEKKLFNPDGSVSQEVRTQPATLAASRAESRSAAYDFLPVLSLPMLHPFRTKAQALIDAADSSTSSRGVQHVVDERGLRSDYVFDDFGRLAYVFNPDTGITRYQYDLADRLVAKHWHDDRSTRYEYDDADRVVRIDAGGDITAVDYGSHGKPTHIRQSTSESVFEYDASGRVISHAQLIDAHQFRTHYSYDAVGRVRERRLPSGESLIYRYNSSVHSRPGVLASIERKGLFGNTVIVDGLNEPSDRFDLQTSRFGNGLHFRRQLDRSGRLQSYGTPQIAEFEFGVDANDRIARIGGHWARTFQYDAASRLRFVSNDDAGLSSNYGFDDAGNIRVARKDDESLLLRVDALSNRVTSLVRLNGEVLDYAYDDAGRTTGIGERHFEYDTNGQLTKVRQGERPLAEYSYNSFGQRIRKVTYSGDQKKVTYFFYDGSKLTAEADQSGKVTKQFVYLEDRVVAIIADDQLYAVHTDWRGSPVAATDEKQRVVWKAQVDELGRADVERAAFELNIRGSQQYIDKESGLHYNTHRYFDTTTGRYLSPDPIGQLGGLNLYAFVDGDPINFVDRLGLQGSPSWEDDRQLSRHASIADWDFDRRLRYVFNTMADLYPGEVGDAIRDLIQPANIALTAGVFLIWAAAHATPAGWAADLVMVGIGAYFLGRGVLTIMRTAFDVARLTTSGACVGDLYQAGETLGRGLAVATTEFSTGVIGGGSARVASAIRQLLRRRPSTASIPDALPNRPPPPPPQGLQDLIGRRLIGPEMSRVPVVPNDGLLGEQIAKQMLESLSGGIFRSIRNASNNGPDLIRIDPVTRTIQHIEVKSSQRARPGWPEGNLAQRFDAWLDEIVTYGSLSGQAVSAPDRAYARQIRDLIQNEQYAIQHSVMQVNIPTAGSTGVPIAELFDWP
jgi:RHS repeat-associated protein